MHGLQFGTENKFKLGKLLYSFMVMVHCEEHFFRGCMVHRLQMFADAITLQNYIW